MRELIKKHGWKLALTGLLAVPAALALDPVWCPERPGNSTDDPISKPKDLSGKSVKCARVRAVHSEDVRDEGATGYLTIVDPFLGYQRGRELFIREFSQSDGVFGEAGKPAGRLLEDQTTRIMTRDHVASCTLCHNVPFRDGGAGATIFKNAGSGRNTPHVFGAGLLEMLGWQIRLQMLQQGDTNRNGFIDKGESENVHAVVQNLSDDQKGEKFKIDFGTFGDKDNDGKPDLNSVCYVWYVDKDGKRISWARSLKDEGVAGYNFEVQVFGWGHGKTVLAGRVPITSTLRAFSVIAIDNHSGLQAYDETLNAEPTQNGFAKVSLLGAQQFFTGRTRDRGAVKDKHGISMDDPDRDGVPEELTEGDMDLLEFYQLNHPSPVEITQTAMQKRGKELLTTTGCASCHTPDWNIQADNRKDADYTKRYVGDRRFFDLVVTPNATTGKLEGKLKWLTDAPGIGKPKRDAFKAEGIYSDLLHHDLGPDFHQVQFDGSVIKAFRTAPLWGVGSTAPYGHDGANLDLDSVIRRHGGEAAESTKAYEALTDNDRLALLEFLRGLQLYSVDDLPCDVNGDGKISDHFIVAGQDTGVERLNPEWLFRVPGRIEGEVTNPMGARVKSFALTNVDQAYGNQLKFLKSTIRTGFPDVRFAPPTAHKPAAGSKGVQSGGNFTSTPSRLPASNTKAMAFSTSSNGRGASTSGLSNGRMKSSQ
jgi:hypothetical protein